MATSTYNGQLNTNELYNALFNMIISQRIFEISVAEPSLANRLKVDGTLYGDTKLYYSMDIGETYEWGNDAEAPRLLELNRNTSQVIQHITLDKFRQANITIDNWLSKRAWGSEFVFVQFSGILTASIWQAKKVFENGYINTYIGTHKSGAKACEISVDMTDLPSAETTSEVEAFNRIAGQRISREIADLYVKMRDNTRDYNEWGFLRAYEPNDLLIVWNAEQKNKIINIDLPMIYNNGGLTPLAGMEIPSKYFGEIITTEGTSTGKERSLVERTFVKADNTKLGYIRAGELIPTGGVYKEGEAYINDNSIICKIISVEGNPFMSSMEVGSVFTNARSLTENHYLTWGYNTMVSLKEKPFVTIKLAE